MSRTTDGPDRPGGQARTGSRRAGGGMVAAAAAVLLAAGCGSSSPSAGGTPTATTGPAGTSPLTSAPSQPAGSSGGASPAAVAEITQVFVTFFNGATAAATKVSLLQNGQQFAPVIQAQASSPLAKGTTAKVTKVSLTSPAAALVTDPTLLNGHAALPNQIGAAALQGATWQVADSSL